MAGSGFVDFPRECKRISAASKRRFDVSKAEAP